MNFISFFTFGPIFLISIELKIVAAQVFDLTLENFDQFTKDKDVMLVEFFAPWCHHCQALAPEWEKAAAALAANREFILGRADCMGTGKTLCDQFHVEMFPTIKLFRHGVFQQDFNGERKADDIVKYLQDAQAQPQAQPAATDPWQTGASFQNTYPMTTPPVYSVTQAPMPYVPAQTPQQNDFLSTVNPTPEWYQSAPALERQQTKPLPAAQAAPARPSALYGNSNPYYNQYKPIASNMPYMNNPAQSPFFGNYPPQPAMNIQPYFPAGNMQRTGASSSFQYNSMNNKPFQAQTEAFQVGLAPPIANVAVPMNQLPGTFQSQLNTLNNQGETFYSVINGRPYAFKRLVNMAFRNFPKNFNQFQRYGPGFLRGDMIPHVIRESVTNHVENTPQRRIFALPSPSRLSASLNYAPTTRQNVQSPSLSLLPTTRQNVERLRQTNGKLDLVKVSKPNPVQRYFTNKQKYRQMLLNYPQLNQRNSLQMKGQIAYNNLGRPKPSIQPSQSAMNRMFQDYRAKLSYANQKAQATNAFNQNPGRYVVSIRGQPGSSTFASFRQKALHDPKFLNNLLKSRSSVAARQPVKQPYVNARQQIMQLWQQQLQRRQNLLSQNKRPPTGIGSPTVLNVPQTDRALIRAKVLRPDLLSHARWAAKGTKTGSARGNIVYVPRSAFTRLPPWYRPKLGPALVKYVVKTADKRRPFPLLAQAKKKESLVRPTPSDIWHRIYSFYNRKGQNQMQEHPFHSVVDKSPTANPQLRGIMRSLPLQNKPSFTPNSNRRISVGKPIYPLKDYQMSPSFLNVQRKINFAGGSHFSNPKGIQKQMWNPVQHRASAPPTEKMKASMFTTKAIPAELWDKRSYIRPYTINKKNSIPQKPSLSKGYWGALKKKRETVYEKGRRHGTRRTLKS